MICPSCDHNNLPGQDQCGNCLQDLAYLDRPVALDRVQRTLMEDPVGSLTLAEPISLPPSATVGRAIALLLDGNIGAIPILDAQGRLAGIFTERDLLLKAADTDGFAERPVSDYMTRRPETVRESDPLAFALHKMDSGGYRHLLVVRHGRLVGVLSVRDLLRHVTRLCKA